MCRSPWYSSRFSRPGSCGSGAACGSRISCHPERSEGSRARIAFAASHLPLELTRDRRATLIAKGATDTIHKDELDSVSIAEMLTRLGPVVAANGLASTG